MTRKIFTFVAAHAVDVESHESAKVHVCSIITEGESLESAFAEIKDHTYAVDATQIFGIEVDKLYVSPNTSLDRIEDLATWQRWAHMNTTGEWENPWTLLHSGPESFADRQDRLLAERMQSLHAGPSL